MTGQAVAAVLTRFGATPTVCDDDPVMLRPHAERGLPTVSSSDAVQQITGYALVVASPGFSPATPLLAAAAAAGVPIWGDVELAWRLDAAGCYGPPRSWLVVTGTNGKTTTTSMLHAMLIAGGRRAVLCGNIGSAVLDVLDEPAELLAVELSSFQLHWAPSLRPEAGAVLNIAEDHLDWHAGVTVIDDAYNANPDSMRAGLQALAWIAHQPEATRRSWAVLGEMAELGEDAIAEHDRIGRLAVRLDVSRLVVVGTGRSISAMHHGAVLEGAWGSGEATADHGADRTAVNVADGDAALALLRAELRPGDVVLVKASNAAGLGAVADALVADDTCGSVRP